MNVNYKKRLCVDDVNNVVAEENQNRKYKMYIDIVKFIDNNDILNRDSFNIKVDDVEFQYIVSSKVDKFNHSYFVNSRVFYIRKLARQVKIFKYDEFGDYVIDGDKSILNAKVLLDLKRLIADEYTRNVVKNKFTREECREFLDHTYGIVREVILKSRPCTSGKVVGSYTQKNNLYTFESRVTYSYSADDKDSIVLCLILEYFKDDKLIRREYVTLVDTKNFYYNELNHKLHPNRLSGKSISLECFRDVMMAKDSLEVDLKKHLEEANCGDEYILRYYYDWRL